MEREPGLLLSRQLDRKIESNLTDRAQNGKLRPVTLIARRSTLHSFRRSTGCNTLLYVKWVVVALNRAGEAWVIDWGTDTHPRALNKIVAEKRYTCAENGKSYRITFGYVDAKCLLYGWDKKLKRYADKHRLWPIAGSNADLATRSISFSHIPLRPKWFGVTIFVDRDAKHEFYTKRINGWGTHREKLRKEPGAHDGSASFTGDPAVTDNRDFDGVAPVVRTFAFPLELFRGAWEEFRGGGLVESFLNQVLAA